MALVLFTSERFAEHLTPPGHPERPERADVMDAIAMLWRERGGETREPRPATPEELLRVHDRDYLDEIAATVGRAVALDPDTYTSPESHEIALLGAGAAIDAARYALDGHGPAVAFVRPPGHHAERSRAMGFCLLNNVAAAAADALAHGASKVAIVDFDVHHGNGTQWIFYDDPRVLYVSTHQFPYYPGTGSAQETGRDRGAGLTINIPLEVGATDADYWHVYDGLVSAVLERFAADLVLISAGYDAHELDPLAGMRMTTAGYAAIVRSLKQTAARASGGRLALVTEGGYHLKAFGACLDATLKELAGQSDDQGDRHMSAPGDSHVWPSPSSPAGTDERARAALAQVRAAQKPYWPEI